MSNDSIQQAVEAGQKNLETMKLVRNWCSHVTVKKHGGTGLIEMQTGLPIGHHFLECPHASAGGMAAWDLADTALDFYDRNCVDCKRRQPVGFPNISRIVAERDAQRKVQEQERERANKASEERLAAREEVRKSLRKVLDPVSATTLDQISELDRTRTDQAAQRLIELVELAPETFRPEIVEYLFSQITSGEYWLFESALQILRRLNVDPTRLCNAALQVLRSYSAQGIAAEIVQAHASLAADNLIAPALPALINLANPISDPFVGGHERRPISKPLRDLYRLHQSAVKDGLKSLLELKDAHDVRLAARGIESLSKIDPTILDFLPMQLAAKLVRAEHLVQGREEEVSGALNDVRGVLTRTFIAKPQETNALIERYLLGASHENAAQLYKIYDEVLHDLRFDHDEKIEIIDAHRLAFRRLIVIATSASNEEVRDTITGMFHGNPYALTPLVIEEIGLLLGSAAVLSTKLDQLDAEMPSKANELHMLQEMNRRSYLDNLMQCFVRWSCVAAGDDGEKSTSIVLEFMRALPEGSTNLRGAIIGGFDALMISTDSLKQCLPDYYSALVGSEQVLRSYAATVLGELNDNVRDNMPALVFEGFVVLLSDPYVVVHRAAISALERFKLPEKFSSTCTLALWNIINVYASERKDDDFLMTTICLYAHRYVSKDALAGRVGSVLIAIMQRVATISAARKLRYSGRIFSANEHYMPLLLKLIDENRAMSLYGDDLIGQLRNASPGAVRANRSAIVAVGKRLATSRRVRETGFLIELLTGADCWKEAIELSSSAYDGIEDNTRNRPIRLHARLRMIASSFEGALAERKLEALGVLRNEWVSTLAEIEKDNEVNRLRRDPLRGLLSSG
ncbi:hypothetical protein [Taklimakanibacter lacteus]|uniref:hypothetical protein n=1 Tax=Taklimakanibacter lacteus TaxID=2268456 RepID=UPI0013C46215